MYVLVVEDDEVISLALRLELEALGFDVDVYSNGTYALRAIETTQYDAAIIDVGLPDIRGDKLASVARDRHARMPIILATGMRTAEIPAELVKDPLVQVLEKPFDTEQLLIAFRKHGTPLDISRVLVVV